MTVFCLSSISRNVFNPTHTVYIPILSSNPFFCNLVFFPRKPKQLTTKTKTKSSTFLFDMRAVWVVYYKIENISRLCG